jgi:peptidoglycan/xylan/chitin deacetylase (PgdA/CDA1 family)
MSLNLGFGAGKRHLLTLSFDDGFRHSFSRIAEIHEHHGLKACLNVLAADDGSFGGSTDDIQQKFPKGDFSLWRALAERGHEIMPHGWNHTNKAHVPLAVAQDLILRCLGSFTREIPGFQPLRSVFNFPYGGSTPVLEEWLNTIVRGYRPGGEGFNPLPHRMLRRVICCATGPTGIEIHMESLVERLLLQDSGWLVYNLHGLDGEGWGPISAEWLDQFLRRMTTIPSLLIEPTASLLTSADTLG